MAYTWILQSLLLLLLLMNTKGEDLYCKVNSNVTITFIVDPPDNRAIWRRKGEDLRDVAINTAGDGCSTPGFTSPPGYEYDCKTVNNTSVYTLKFKSNSSDVGIVYSLESISPVQKFIYKPSTSTADYTDCEDKASFGNELKCKVECNCMKPSLSWKYVTEDQTERNITIPNTDPVSCGSGGENFYKLDINIKSSDIEKLLPTTVTGKVNITGILSIGDEKINLSTTINVKTSSSTISYSTNTPSVTADVSDTTMTSSTTGSTNGSSSDGCDWCVPVFGSIGGVIGGGIIIGGIWYVKSKKKKKEKSNKTPMAEMSKPKP